VIEHAVDRAARSAFNASGVIVHRADAVASG